MQFGSNVIGKFFLGQTFPDVSRIGSWYLRTLAGTLTAIEDDYGSLATALAGASL